MNRCTACRAALLWLVFQAAAAAAAAVPPGAALEVKVVPSEPSVTSAARDLERVATRIVQGVETRTGLRAERAITVVVAPRLPEGPESRARLGVGAAPFWAAGIAQPRLGRMVLFLDRARGHPHRDLAGVVAHETSHLLLAWAIPPGRSVPRWYDEGLATSVERGASLRDAIDLARLVVTKRPIAFSRLERSWPRNAEQARAAYAQSFSFVAYVEERAPTGGPARLVAALGVGASFPVAFERAYGLRPESFEVSWRRMLRWRLVTLPLIVAGATINVAIGLLILVAYGSARVRRRRILERWEDEERFQDSGGPPGLYGSR